HAVAQYGPPRFGFHQSLCSPLAPRVGSARPSNYKFGEGGGMAAWRTLASLVITLAAAGTGWGQTYSLAEAPVAGKYFRIETQMKLAGEMRLRQEKKTVTLKQTAQAEHVYLERILDVGPTGLARKSAQFFQTAKATVKVSNHVEEKSLRPQRQLLVAQRFND